MTRRADLMALWVAFAWSIAVALYVILRVAKVPSVLVPVGITALPLAIPRRRVARVVRLICLLLLAMFVFLTILSIGWLYVPSLVALALSAGWEGPRAGGNQNNT
jgi:hypothetical protein